MTKRLGIEIQRPSDPWTAENQASDMSFGKTIAPRLTSSHSRQSGLNKSQYPRYPQQLHLRRRYVIHAVQERFHPPEQASHPVEL